MPNRPLVPLPELFECGDPDQIRDEIERGWTSGAIALYGVWRGREIFSVVPILPPGRDAQAFRARFFPETRITDGKVALDRLGAKLRIERWDGQIELWTDLAADAAGRDWLLKRCAGAGGASPPSRAEVPPKTTMVAAAQAWLVETFPGAPPAGMTNKMLAEQYRKATKAPMSERTMRRARQPEN